MEQPVVHMHTGGGTCLQIKDVGSYEAGQQLNVEDMFKAGDLVDVAGTTIGKGFQGKLHLMYHVAAIICLMLGLG